MLLLPTLNRIDRLTHCLKTMTETSVSTPGMVVVDELDYRAHRNDYDVIENKFLPHGWSIRITKGVSMGDKFRELWDTVKGGEFLGVINDDFSFVTPEWDKKLISRLDGTNFVTTNDRKIRSFQRPSGVTIWSTPLLVAAGFPAFPCGLQHLYVDDSWLQIHRGCGCWRPVMSVVVLHHHFLDGEATFDETYHKTYDDFFAKKCKDTDIYDLFIKHDLAPCVERVKALQNTHIPRAQKYNPGALKPSLAVKP